MAEFLQAVALDMDAWIWKFFSIYALFSISTVEWVFEDIINYFKKDLKIGLSAVGKSYTVCAILRNALTCLHGSTTSKFFDVQPPALDEYFI